MILFALLKVIEDQLKYLSQLNKSLQVSNMKRKIGKICHVEIMKKKLVKNLINYLNVKKMQKVFLTVILTLILFSQVWRFKNQVVIGMDARLLLFLLLLYTSLCSLKNILLMLPGSHLWRKNQVYWLVRVQ